MQAATTSTFNSIVKISNETFLREVFGQEWGRAHVCAFEEDPSQLDALGLRHYWGGGPAHRLLGKMRPGENQYFTISLFDVDPVRGEPRRKKALHEATYLIPIDDVGVVGAPGSTAKIGLGALNLPPSYVLETSPGNYQIGYLLTAPDTRSGKVSGLLDALVAEGLGSDGKDPGMKGVTRYVRLPEGFNTKALYVDHSVSGPAGFGSIMRQWNPKLRYTLEDIADAYGVRGLFDEAPEQLGSGIGAGTRVATGAGDDWVLDALGRMGRVRQQLGPGVWDIECPFIDDHTARADSGAAYLGGGNFKCWHGHCDSKGSSEFMARLAELDGGAEALGLAKREELAREFGSVSEGVEDNPFVGMEGEVQVPPSPVSLVSPGSPGDEFGTVGSHAAVSASGSVSNTTNKFGSAFSAEELNPLFSVGPVLDQAWLVKNLFPRVGIGCVYGGPKTGKTFVAMDLAARVASGMAWYGHGMRRTGDLVVYVSAEGGSAAAWNRAYAWCQEHGVWPGNLLVWPGVLQIGAGLVSDAVALRDWIRDELGRRGASGTAMIVLDTLNKNMVGDENSTEDMTGFVGVCDRLSRALDTFVLIVHHSGKDTARGMRGSSVLLGAVEAEIEITRDKDKGIGEPGRIVLANLRHAEDGKVYGFKFKWTKLGVDQDLEDVGTLVVEECAPPTPGLQPVRIGAWERAMLDCIPPGETWTDTDILDELAARVRNGDFEGLNPRRPNANRKTLDSLLEKGLLQGDTKTGYKHAENVTECNENEGETEGK